MLPSTVVDRDPAARQQLLDRAAQARQVVLDHDVGPQQQPVVLVDRVQAGLAGAPTEQIDDARRLRLHVGDLGVGDEHRGRGPRQPDHPAFAHLEAERAFGRDRLRGVLADRRRRQQADEQGQPEGEEVARRGARDERPAPAADVDGTHYFDPCWTWTSSDVAAAQHEQSRRDPAGRAARARRPGPR